jgi:hypothetical protein
LRAAEKMRGRLLEHSAFFCLRVKSWYADYDGAHLFILLFRHIRVALNRVLLMPARLFSTADAIPNREQNLLSAAYSFFRYISRCCSVCAFAFLKLSVFIVAVLLIS